MTDNVKRLPFSIVKKGDLITSISMAFPQITQYDAYVDQFKSIEFSQINVQQFKITSRNSENCQIISWLKEILSHFKFNQIELQISKFNSEFNIISQLQPTIEELSISVFFPADLITLGVFLKNQIHFNNLRKFQFLFEQLDRTSTDIPNYLSQIIANNFMSLESIHISLDIKNFVLFLISLFNLFQQRKLIKFNNLQELILNFLPIDLSIQDNLISDGIQIYGDYIFLSSLFSIIDEIRHVQLYFSQTLTQLSMYEDICQFFLRQNNLEQIVLYLSRSRIQFDILQIFKVFSKLKNLYKIDINLDYSTQAYVSEVENAIDLPQVTHLNLSLSYSSCAETLLRQIKLSNLQQFLINLSWLRNQDMYSPCFDRIIQLIENNKELKNMKIDILSDQEKDTETQIQFINKLIKQNTNQFQDITMSGFSHYIFSQESFAFLFNLNNFLLFFPNAQRIQKINKSLVIQNYPQRSDFRINRYFLIQILEFSKDIINQIEFNGDLQLKEESEPYGELIETVFEYSQKYQKLLSIKLIFRIPRTHLKFQSTILAIQMLEACPNILNLSLNYDLQAQRLQPKDLKNLIKLLQERYSIQQINLNSYLSPISNVVRARAEMFKKVIYSLKWLKRHQVQLKFRKDIIKEIIFTSFQNFI